MKWKLDRIISVATLVTSVAALVLVLKKPAPVAPAQSPAAAAANVESVEKKLEQLDQPKEPGQAPAQVRFNSDEITAALGAGSSGASQEHHRIGGDGRSRRSVADWRANLRSRFA